MNELLCVCILMISLIVIYITRKYSNKLGLMIVYITSSILSFILTFKLVTISTLNFNSNAIIYVTMFTSLYLLLDKHSKKEVSSIINFGFIMNIFCAIMLYLMSYYIQSLTDTVGINMKNVFINNSRILIVYPITILISQQLLTVVYDKIKNLYDNIFISTVTTYLAVGLIEALLYTFITYLNILEPTLIIKLLLSTYMTRLIITVIYSLFLTITDKKKVTKWVT